MNLSKLKGKIVEHNLNVAKVAESLGINEKTLYRKLNDERITVGEAAKLKDILLLTDAEAIEIFLR